MGFSLNGLIPRLHFSVGIICVNAIKVVVKLCIFLATFPCPCFNQAGIHKVTRISETFGKITKTDPFSSVAWPSGVQLVILFCFRFSVLLFGFPGTSSRQATQVASVESRSLFFMVFYMI